MVSKARCTHGDGWKSYWGVACGVRLDFKTNTWVLSLLCYMLYIVRFTLKVRAVRVQNAPESLPPAKAERPSTLSGREYRHWYSLT